MLKEVRALTAAEIEPAAQAAARATACATITTLTNALGDLFYGTAAVTYDRAGLFATTGTYDVLAIEAFVCALAELLAMAVESEANPVKNC